MKVPSHDIILAGAGLSGLTLALELARRPAFQDKKILLLDRDDKRQNDRTWCFWATDEEPLPPVLYRTWDRCRFFSPDIELKMDISPYRYRMVRGIDFYEWARKELSKHPHITSIQTSIRHIDAAAGTVYTDAGDFSAEQVFNSAFTKIPVLPPPSSLYPTPPFSTEPPSTEPPSTVHRQPSTVYRQPSTVHRPPSTVHRPPSTVHR
ncbi:MAG: lycopene cyclase family protein, partial [Thermoanaerobaculia bacterium]|nr:lycopene cyclase family protein [Thermoanaerobaculia bacterium]